jgi:hypothetical protein
MRYTRNTSGFLSGLLFGQVTLMLPYVCGAMQFDALDAKVYLHLDILRISSLVSRLSVVTNQITKIYGFLKVG